MKLMDYIKLSRPRFWVYVFGPFLVVTAFFFNLSGINFQNPFLELSMVQPSVWIVLFIFFFFFTFPANLLIYGVNDIYDYETDKLNPKKVAYESLLSPQRHPLVFRAIFIAVLPFILFALLLNLSPYFLMVVFLFLLCSWFYSAPPIRAKVRPPLDILFSSLIYILPGVIAFVLFSSMAHADAAPLFLWSIFIAALLWASAMQTFSAVPDIQSDQQAGMSTLATWLGAQATIVFCIIMYVAAAWLSFSVLGWAMWVLLIPYLCLMLYALYAPDRYFTIYTWFPWVNTVLGMFLFFFLLLK